MTDRTYTTSLVCRETYTCAFHWLAGRRMAQGGGARIYNLGDRGATEPETPKALKGREWEGGSPSPAD